MRNADRLMACPINGWPDHPWRPWHHAAAICAVSFCYYRRERHEGQGDEDGDE
jgi:hypothetical protein